MNVSNERSQGDSVKRYLTVGSEEALATIGRLQELLGLRLAEARGFGATEAQTERLLQTLMALEDLALRLDPPAFVVTEGQLQRIGRGMAGEPDITDTEGP